MARSSSFLNITFDNKALRKIKKELNKIKTYHNEWGWINRAKYTSIDKNNRANTYVATIAFRNEYGDIVTNNEGKLIEIPSRPYFFQSIPEASKLNKLKSFEIFKAALTNQPWFPIMQDTAKLSRNTLYAEINKQNQTPLAPKTIRLKGGDYQWDDTGVLLGNISYKTTKAKLKDD